MDNEVVAMLADLLRSLRMLALLSSMLQLLLPEGSINRDLGHKVLLLLMLLVLIRVLLVRLLVLIRVLLVRLLRIEEVLGGDSSHELRVVYGV